MANLGGFGDLFRQAMQNRVQNIPQPQQNMEGVVPEDERRRMLDELLKSQQAAPTPAPAPVQAPTTTVDLQQAASQANLEALDASRAAVELESKAAGDRAQQQSQQLLQNAAEVTQEAGGPQVVQAQVSQGLSQAVGEDVSPEEAQGAVPLMKELLADLDESRAGIKSELSKKLETGSTQGLSKQEKIAVGLLMILPAIAGAIIKGKQGLGAGLQASGQGLLALNKGAQQQQLRAEESQQAESKRRTGLRKELLDIDLQRVKIADALQAREEAPLQDAVGEDLAKEIRAENNGKPLNEAQSKNVLFGARMQESGNTLNDIEKTLDVNDPATAAQLARIELPFTEAALQAPNVLRSPEIQKFLQAQRDFTNAVFFASNGSSIVLLTQYHLDTHCFCSFIHSLFC